MLVNLQALKGTLIFGAAITVFAIFGKVVGSGAAALLVGFNTRGGFRIGLGMLPRGEVALIIAGVGVSTGVIGQEVFGISVMMTLITTLIAPVFFLNALQKGGSGLSRRRVEDVVYYDVCALEDPEKYRHRFDKEWDAVMGEEWRNDLIKVLSEKGCKRIRGIHGRECHLFTFQGEDKELFSITETLDPETSLVRTRLYSTHDSLNEYIQQADRLYNERRKVTFL